VRPVRVALLGYGRVGQAVAARAEVERARLNEAGLDLSCRTALVRDLGKPRGGPALRLSDSAAAVLNDPVDVVVEVLGGVEPARTYVSAALDAGVPVVSANKSLVARHGHELRALAHARGTTFAFDAAVIAGVPFLGSLSRRPLASGIVRIEGIVNGTSAYVLNEIARGATFGAALGEAVARGYAEPDSAADTSGLDAAEKLTILLHLCGRHDIRVDDLARRGIDALEPADFVRAAALGGTIKPVVLASLDADDLTTWVGPAFVPHDHPFAQLDGMTNSLRLIYASGEVVTFTGPGAGPDITAATILDDIVETVGTRHWALGTGHRR
jgi:homoserine dehydrogenase